MSQSQWRWCSKDQTLFFAGNAVCPAGGVHNHSASGDYSLVQNGTGQNNWKWCKKCQVLSYTGNVIGPCSQGGQHDVSSSGNYILSNERPGGQQGWKWCKKCQGLGFSGANTPGPCQVGGQHDHSGSGLYSLSIDGKPPGGQDQWRWCNNCNLLAFDGNTHCTAGGAHISVGSGLYTLWLNDTTSNGQDNWRWYNKCYGLAYAGNPSPGRAFRAECTTTPAAGIINFKTTPENLRDFRINGLGAANASCCGIVAMDRRGARKVLLSIMTKTVRGIIPSSTFPEARRYFPRIII